MSKIVIIGAGAMGSAFSLPCLDNNHDINIVGTHLENNFIDQLKKNSQDFEVEVRNFNSKTWEKFRYSKYLLIHIKKLMKID